MAETNAVQRAEARLRGMRDDRYGWWQHWRELATYILPRRYRWLVTPNEARRGAQINQAILDSTGTIAARDCAAGMMSGVTSPTRPWFNLRVGNSDAVSQSISMWLEECEKRMMRVFQESNFYDCMGQVYFDLVVFGTACADIREDYEDVIRCQNSCLGEYYFANDSRGAVGTVGREFTKTLSQIQEEFGDDMPQDLKTLLESSAFNDSKEILVAHLIEPNKGSGYNVPKRFKFRELYWVVGRTDNGFLRQRGLFEWNVMAPRWDLAGNDAYGRSPGMDALGDIKQLQQETKRKAQAIDKMVTPPMLADIQLKNQPASLLPGGVTYVAGLDSKAGMRPVYQVQPPVQELMQDIKEIQDRIKRIFFNDLFQMFQMLQAEPRSAAAVDARREEKLIMLGPVLERFQNEALAVAIDRTFGIMQRGGLLPEPPPELMQVGGPKFIRVEYASMLAQAQRAVRTGSIERLWQAVGQQVAIRPESVDMVDWDTSIADYAVQLDVPPSHINPPDKVAKLRKDRADQLAQQNAAAQGPALAQGAKNLSQADIGGGQNALAAMLGNGTVQ